MNTADDQRPPGRWGALKLHPRAAAASAALAYGAMSIAASWTRRAEVPLVYVVIVGVGLAGLVPWRALRRQVEPQRGLWPKR